MEFWGRQASRSGPSPARRPGGRHSFRPGPVGAGWARSSASCHPGAEGGLSGLRPSVPAQAGAQPPGVWGALASDWLARPLEEFQRTGTTGQPGRRRGHAEPVVPGPPQRARLARPPAGGPGPPEPPVRSLDSAGPEPEEGPLLAALLPWPPAPNVLLPAGAPLPSPPSRAWPRPTVGPLQGWPSAAPTPPTSLGRGARPGVEVTQWWLPLCSAARTAVGAGCWVTQPDGRQKACGPPFCPRGTVSGPPAGLQGPWAGGGRWASSKGHPARQVARERTEALTRPGPRSPSVPVPWPGAPSARRPGPGLPTAGAVTLFSCSVLL